MKDRTATTLIKGFKAKAEKIAAEARLRVGLKQQEPMAGLTLAHSMNVGVLPHRQVLGLGPYLYALEGRHRAVWSATTFLGADGRFWVIMNENHSLKRQESNLMHELAHLVCKHDMKGIERRDGFPFLMRTYNEQQEDEANWLGGCLQLPRVALEWAVTHGMSEAAMADHFNASSQMVTYRLNVTGTRKAMSPLER